jgi:hypothetical protein
MGNRQNSQHDTSTKQRGHIRRPGAEGTILGAMLKN